MIPEAVRRERQQRCDCGATDGQLHSPGCACWPRPRRLYQWLAGKSHQEICMARGDRWDRIFQLAVRVRHPWLWTHG